MSPTTTTIKTPRYQRRTQWVVSLASVLLHVVLLLFILGTLATTTIATTSSSPSSSSSSSQRQSYRQGISPTLSYYHTRKTNRQSHSLLPWRQQQQLRGGDAIRQQDPTKRNNNNKNSAATGVDDSRFVEPVAVAATTTVPRTEESPPPPPPRSILRRSPPPSLPSSLRTVYAVSFLVFFSSSLVALSPVQALQQRLDNAARATQVLSALSATAALAEITVSSMVGRLLDVAGRKPALVTIVATLAGINAITALQPTVVTICAQKLLNTLAIGFFFLTSQTILSDIVVTSSSGSSGSDSSLSETTTATTSSLVSAAMGRQLALTGLGFLLGILGAGQVSDLGLPVVYGIASGMGVVALLLIQFGLIETMPKTTTQSIDTESQPHNPNQNLRRGGRYSWLVFQSPLSCTRLLTRHGPRVRTLGVLLMLMTLPVFMGDFFQIFARQEWQLSTRSFSTFLALFGVVGIAANTAGSILVKAWGIKTFTTVAVLSKLFTTVATVIFGYKGSIVGLVFGFLGSAQSIGIVAALIAEGAKSGLPMGEMAGERASLMALLKVIGPIWYSTLYLQGQRWMQTSYLPFVFNTGLCLVALMVSQWHL